ncbi:MAG TPA: hypothetical protein ENH82_11420 [bacterium]|nr:hypothetical protein [bacterium]
MTYACCVCEGKHWSMAAAIACCAGKVTKEPKIVGTTVMIAVPIEVSDNDKTKCSGKCEWRFFNCPKPTYGDRTMYVHFNVDRCGDCFDAEDALNKIKWGAVFKRMKRLLARFRDGS